MENNDGPTLDGGAFAPPPTRWLVLVVLVIVAASSVHVWTRSAMELRAGGGGGNGADLKLRIDEVQAYVDKMEKEVRLLEAGEAGKAGAGGAPPATFDVPHGGGLRTFSHAKKQSPHPQTSGDGSSLHIVAEAFSNTSSRETFRPAGSAATTSVKTDTSSSSSSSSGSGGSGGGSGAGASPLEQALEEMRAGGDADMARWHAQLTRKLRCAQSHRGGIFLYHVRKAAGTSVKDVLQHASQRWRVPLYETEGLSLDPRFLVPQSLLSVLTMRDPVERVLSMYWYEHVGWYDGILKQPEKCKTLQQWVAAWRDGSDWKRRFISLNPRSVYVEIENYYIKMLIGWTGAEAIGPAELEQAKAVLRHFDVVLIMEWMQDARQVDAMNALFPGRGVVAAKHMLRGDAKVKRRLEHKLGADLPAVRLALAEANRLDLLLWEYAQSLLARRLRVVQLAAAEAHRVGAFVEEKTAHAQCGAHSHSVHGRLDKDLVAQLGIFRPPGHKGPF